MDVCGPVKHPASGENKYYIATFIDDESDMSFVYIMNRKSEVKECLALLWPFIERQSGNKLKCIQSDGGKEYLNKSIGSHCEENGIIHQVTIRHTPEQNGRAERLNRTLLEKVRCLIWSIVRFQKTMWRPFGEKQCLHRTSSETYHLQGEMD